MSSAQRAGGRPNELTFARDGLTFRATSTARRGGTPAVLLHGFPGSRQTWRAVVEHLSGAGIRTATLEQRGYGPTARSDAIDAYRLPALAADVVALTEELGVDRCHLVGHDWGGIVAWYLAATQPSRWASLTVLSTPHPRAYAAATVRIDQGCGRLTPSCSSSRSCPKRC